MPHVSPSRVILPPRLAAEIHRAAAAAHPEECCGLLVGAGGAEVTVGELTPTANVADDRRRGFAIDPQVQFDVLRELRGTSRRIVGHYHSHPTGEAVPSAHDLAMAHDPEMVWLLAGEGRLRAYIRPAGASSFVEIPLSEV